MAQPAACFAPIWGRQQNRPRSGRLFFHPHKNIDIFSCGANIHAALTRGYIMETKLVPIFTLRAMCLEKISPRYFATNAEMIKGTSLAAQDYVLSKDYLEYSPYMGLNFKELPKYVAVHKKYNLPYAPNERLLGAGGINPGLVMDLAQSFHKDTLDKIIDDRGNIIAPNKIYFSEVMKTYHNSTASGVPIDALRNIEPSQLEAMLTNIQKTR